MAKPKQKDKRPEPESEGEVSAKTRDVRRSCVMLALLALGGAGVGAGGYLVWQSLHTPAVTTVEHGDQLSPELTAAIEQHVEAARREPRNADLRAALGLVYEANKLWSKAHLCFQNATTLDPNEPMWPHHAAIAGMKVGDTEGATTWMRRYAARFPKFAPLQHRLGVALLDAGEIAEAATAFRQVITLEPAIGAGYVGLGDVLIRSDDPSEAARVLEQAVELDPTDKAARYLLGRAYRRLGLLEQAEREMTLGRGASLRFLQDAWGAKVSDLDLSLGGQQTRAGDLMKTGHPAQAAEVLERILASDPDNAEALLNLGAAYLEMGRLDLASELLHQVERLKPGSFEVYINLTTCYRRLGRPAEALEYADRAVALAPGIAQTNHVRGLALMQMGRNEEALAVLTAAVSLDARNPKSVQDLANVCMRLGRYVEAATHFETLASLLPTRWEPHLGLAKANYQLGRIDEAEVAITAGLELSPGEPQLLVVLEGLRRIQDR